MRRALISLGIAIIFALPAFAEVPAVIDGSGQPLPRFVSLKFDKVYARTGPDQTYPIAWIYQREGMPVEILHEYNDWRQVRDHDGGGGWVHRIQLAAKRTVLIQGVGVIPATDDDALGSPVVARLQPLVLARLDKCHPDTCRVEGDNFKGWVPRKSLWGIYPGEDLH